MKDILYSSITASAQVKTHECYIVGIEISGNGGKMEVYDEADSSKTASKLLSTIKSSSYYHYNNIIFPYPGVKCNGIYTYLDSGTGTVYYHLGTSGNPILYQSITADVQVTTQSCYFIGAEIIEGTIAIYDEADSGKTGANLISTMKIGSHRHYKSMILPEPMKCVGIYADVTDGEGTIYYRF